MNVYFFVFGSSIVTWRVARSIGNACADGCVEPCLQNAGFSFARIEAASHSRPSRPNIELWLLAWVSQIRSVPQ